MPWLSSFVCMVTQADAFFSVRIRGSDQAAEDTGWWGYPGGGVSRPLGQLQVDDPTSTPSPISAAARKE